MEDYPPGALGAAITKEALVEFEDDVEVGLWKHRPCGSPGYRYRFIEVNGVKLKQRDSWCHLCETREFMDFMVKHEIWAESGCEGVVCLDCFEAELGREVTTDDLIDAPINEKFFRGAKMDGCNE